MRVAMVAALLMVMVADVTSGLIACGDKFLVPARSTRYSMPPPKRQSASLLLYAPLPSEMSRTVKRLGVARTLQKAGYRVTETATEQQLATALTQSRWDLVLVDFSEVKLVTGRGEPAAPAVMPVSYALSRNEWTAAREEYPLLVRSPTKAQSWLDAVDAALQARGNNGVGDGNR